MLSRRPDSPREVFIQQSIGLAVIGGTLLAITTLLGELDGVIVGGMFVIAVIWWAGPLRKYRSISKAPRSEED